MKRPSLVDSRLDRWAEVHAGLDPAVGTVVRGHTHMPFARLAHGRLVVNPGGVGMPYGRPGAHWALLGSGVDAAADHVRHRRRVRPVAAESGYPGAADWPDYFVRARATDAEALAVFGPRDGRS